jgi:hypothetical protein
MQKMLDVAIRAARDMTTIESDEGVEDQAEKRRRFWETYGLVLGPPCSNNKLYGMKRQVF